MADERRDTDETAALLTRVARGSRGAFEALYRKLHARIYAFALRRLNDPFEAADIVNEVMLEVWRSARRFEGRSRALTYILGIAHHKVLDRLRGRREEAAHETDTEPADDTADVYQALIGARDAEFLRGCLERLSDAQRAVVHLAFFGDLSYTEIAHIVGCPVGTVKTRMFHAKRLLKACLSALATGREPFHRHEPP